MARLRGWAPKGQRCHAAIPHGHWKTVTFVGGLTLAGFIAPMLLDGPMDGEVFQAWCEDWGFPPSWVVRKLLPETVNRAGHAAIIPVFDESLTYAASREVLPEIRRTWSGIGTLSWFMYGKWTSAALLRVNRLLQG
jgi:hypothetical protein